MSVVTNVFYHYRNFCCIFIICVNNGKKYGAILINNLEFVTTHNNVLAHFFKWPGPEHEYGVSSEEEKYPQHLNTHTQAHTIWLIRWIDFHKSISDFFIIDKLFIFSYRQFHCIQFTAKLSICKTFLNSH